MLQKLVDQGFMTATQKDYLTEAVANKDSIIISGHKGWGILPLMASTGAVVKGSHTLTQVKTSDDLSKETDYFMIGNISSTDFEQLVLDAISVPNTSLLTIKDPEHPYSVMKVLRTFYKNTKDTSKTFQVLECVKNSDDNNILSKITKFTMDENGKLSRENFEG